MSAYMWNSAYYFNQQTTEANKQQQYNMSSYSSPLNSSNETCSDLNKSSLCTSSSYLESPYSYNKNNAQNDLENSYNGYYQHGLNEQVYTSSPGLSQNYFGHNDQYLYNNIYSNNQANVYRYYQQQEITSSSSVPSKPKLAIEKPLKSVLTNEFSSTIQIENPKANKSVKVKLEDTDIWQRFSQIGTEMIVTKSGRRMFPAVRVSVSGLSSSAKYNMIVDIVSADDDRYKFQSGKWIVNGKADIHFSDRGYLHPDSPLTGSQWMKHIISFHKLKITNNPFDRQGHIVLNSMQKYVPRLHLIEVDGKSVNTFVLSEANFMAVTAYQNEMITKLKIEYNPFAKGFREVQNRKEVTKRSSDEEPECQTTRTGFNFSISSSNCNKMPNYGYY